MWEEDSDLPRIHSYIRLRLCVAILRNILLGIIFKIWQIAKRCITEGFCSRDRYLDINHLDVGLQESRILCTLFSHLKIQKQILVLNRVLSRLHCLEIVVLQKLYHISKKWVQSHIFTEILNRINNHSNIIFSCSISPVYVLWYNYLGQ